MSLPHPNSADAALALWLNSLPIPANTNAAASNQNGLPNKPLPDLIIDGDVLWQVLATLDPNFFRASRPSSISGALSDQWVLRFTSFKKMYKLIVRYFEDRLRKSLKDFEPVPNLHKIAKDGDESESILLCMMVLTLATLVHPDLHVPKIQALPTWAQTALMLGIESVSSKLGSLEMSRSPLRGRPADEGRTGSDPLGARRLSDSSSRDAAADLAEQLRLLQIEHENVCKEMRLLGKAHDDATHKLQMAEQDLKAAQDELQSAGPTADARPASPSSDDNDDRQSHSRQEYLLRVELDQAKQELDSLGAKLDQAEANHERDVAQLGELRRRLDELADVEEQNRGLRDQLDEARHDKERARKMENVMEKYKKKLEESADLRRQMKTLEEQNSDLLDRNTALEDEYRKVAAFKPLMEQYKSQIATLEADLSARRREHDRVQYELEGARARAQQAEEERAREAEALALFEERVKELEEEEPLRGARRRRRRSDEDADEAGGLDVSFERHVDEETGILAGIGGELNDAIEGRTMTSLKLELRKLQREISILRAAQDEEEEGGPNKSRYLVLENLLEDANRMKRKYEDDYLRQYRETLVLSTQLEEIRNGKSGSGDGAEASIALRQRLNETVEELEKLKAEHTELSVSYEQLTNELTLAKSDLHLVGKDQLEMLSSLRESVSSEKIGLEEELGRLKQEQGAMRDELRMKTEQIQTLLLEKIGLQSDSIDQRERLLRRELDGAAKGQGEVPEGERMRVGVLEELLKAKEEECRLLKGKLEKAKLFIMNQDKLYKESISGRAAALGPLDVSVLTDGMNEAHKAELAALKESVERLQIQNGGIEARYQRELRLMGSAWHNLGQQKLRETIALNRNDVQGHGAGGGGGARVGGPGGPAGKASGGFGGQLRPQSWMKVQRDRMMNQYSLNTIKVYPVPKRVPMYCTTVEEGKMW